MFEAAELNQSLSPKRYDSELPGLRSSLLEAQFDLRKSPFSVIVIVSGADGAGKGELVQRLNEWLDPRGVETHAFWSVSDEERERPAHWRFWRALPGRGRIGIYFGSWYTQPIISRVEGDMTRGRFTMALDRILALERMLAADGTQIVKLWLHMPKKAQKKRLKKLDRKGRIAPGDWEHFELYDRFTRISERALRHTDTGSAPWHVIEATDRRFREFTAGRLLLEHIEKGLKTMRGAGTASAKAAGPRISMPPAAGSSSILDHVDLKKRMAREEYERQLKKQQNAMNQLAWTARKKGRSVVLVFEGWDAAGKGSAIRRVTQAMDPRLYRAVGIAAPTDEERAHHYLWRFWRRLPRAGEMTIFDRSWYGRVLVERVEGFATKEAWSRAYHEINEFEEQLAEHGIILCKFWLHISQAEQLRRFRDREHISYKRYKITEEDWRNRRKWKDYKAAVDDMVAHCSTPFAPWTLVPATDKHFARIQVIKTVVHRLRDAL